MLASTATDVGRRAQHHRARVGRVEARRRAHPGPPARRHGAPLHAQPQRRDRSHAVGRRRAARAPGRGRGARRRGHGRDRGRSARGVPGLGEHASVGATRPGPVTLDASWFDILHLDGRDLIDEPLETRLAAMDTIPTLRRIPSVRTDDADVAQTPARRRARHRPRGRDGQVARVDLRRGPARARRGARSSRCTRSTSWCSRVEWGSGRRRGLLSNLHLGALGPDGAPVMVGKTFKGLTDELLAWQTERFLELETHRDGHVVFVRPEQVVEIALDGAQVVDPLSRWRGAALRPGPALPGRQGRRRRRHARRRPRPAPPRPPLTRAPLHFSPVLTPGAPKTDNKNGGWSSSRRQTTGR